MTGPRANPWAPDPHAPLSTLQGFSEKPPPQAAPPHGKHHWSRQDAQRPLTPPGQEPSKPAGSACLAQSGDCAQPAAALVRTRQSGGPTSHRLLMRTQGMSPEQARQRHPSCPVPTSVLVTALAPATQVQGPWPGPLTSMWPERLPPLTHFTSWGHNHSLVTCDCRHYGGKGWGHLSWRGRGLLAREFPPGSQSELAAPPWRLSPPAGGFKSEFT